MGQGYGIKCSRCDYNKYLHLGIGMLYSPESVFFKNDFNNKPMLESLVRSKKIKEHALKLLNNGGVPYNDYGHCIYFCPHCNEIYERFYFCIKAENEKYKPEYHCSKCKHILKRVKRIEVKDKFKLSYLNNKIIEWKCPKCGNDELEEDINLGVLMWD